MTTSISEQLLSQCSEFVTARFGLHFPRKRWRDLERGMVRATRELGFADAVSCIGWLLTEQLTREQTEILARCLTVGETYFFREQKSFEALEAHILPELISSRQGKEQRLRIWCAGCSTGEEPYSIAILLHRMIADLAAWNVTILATDINPAALRKAMRGEYGDWSFRGTPRWIKEKYFTTTGEGRVEICAPIRKMVTFAPLNLAEDTYPALSTNTNAMDIIFCRNVLMYFSPEQVQRVIGKIHHSLVAGGWLIVSPCETSSTLFAEFSTVHIHDSFFYRRESHRQIEAAPHPVATGAATVPPRAVIDQGTAPEVITSRLPEPLFPVPTVEPALAAPRVSPYEEALRLYEQGKYAEAAAGLARFLSNTPPEPASPVFGEAAALLAQAFANQGNFTEALEWSEKAVAADRLNPRPYYLQATIFQEQGADEAAIIALQRTLYLDHEFVLAHFALASLIRRQGKKKEAARHLQNATELLRTYGDDDILPGSDGLSARRLAEIIAATRESIS